MVQISVDTDKDSVQTIRGIIRFLEEELRRRGEMPSYPSPSNPPIQPMMDHNLGTVENNNPFAMFGETSSDPTRTSPSTSSSPSSSSSLPPSSSAASSSQNPFDMFNSESTPSSSPESTSGGDIFSVFGNDANEDADAQVHPIQESLQTQESLASTKTASELLDEEDVHDVTQDFAEQVMTSGSTREKEKQFRLEPYE